MSGEEKTPEKKRKQAEDQQREEENNKMEVEEGTTISFFDNLLNIIFANSINNPNPNNTYNAAYITTETGRQKIKKTFLFKYINAKGKSRGFTMPLDQIQIFKNVQNICVGEKYIRVSDDSEEEVKMDLIKEGNQEEEYQYCISPNKEEDPDKIYYYMPSVFRENDTIEYLDINNVRRRAILIEIGYVFGKVKFVVGANNLSIRTLGENDNIVLYSCNPSQETLENIYATLQSNPNQKKLSDVNIGKLKEMVETYITAQTRFKKEFYDYLKDSLNNAYKDAYLVKIKGKANLVEIFLRSGLYFKILVSYESDKSMILDITLDEIYDEYTRIDDDL